MASKIKKFFKSKKNEAKFKLGMAGPGHRLGDTSSSQQSSGSSQGSRPMAPRVAPSAEAQQAAAAALARLQRPADKPAFNTSLAAVRAQARKELEAEQAAAAATESQAAKPDGDNPSAYKSTLSHHDPAQLAATGIFFTCPLIGPEVLPKEEWHVKIREFLYEQLEHERALTAVIMIHTLNKNKEKVEQCVKTIHRMFENINNNPNEEKYRRIKLEGRAFQEKVKDMEGGMELLLAAGFVEKEEETSPGQKERFLVYPEDKLSDVDQLTLLCDALDSAEPITLELDRGLQVLLPSQASRRQQLPPEFFRLTPEDIKKEQQMRTEAVERSMMLRTKAMREKEELREMKMYKYAIIRFRFPDGVLLQGTFSVYEKFEAVWNFVKESVVERDEDPELGSFSLTTPTGHKLTEGCPEFEQNLLELRLVPATILIFAWNKLNTSGGQEEGYLKPELLVLMQEV